jgi:hypothetical protein
MKSLAAALEIWAPLGAFALLRVTFQNKNKNNRKNKFRKTKTNTSARSTIPP